MAFWSTAAARVSYLVLTSVLAGCSSDEARSPSACADCETAPDTGAGGAASADPEDLDGDGRGNDVDGCDARDFGRIVVLDSTAGVAAREVLEADLLPLLGRARGEPFRAVV